MRGFVNINVVSCAAIGSIMAVLKQNNLAARRGQRQSTSSCVFCAGYFGKYVLLTSLFREAAHRNFLRGIALFPVAKLPAWVFETRV